MNGNGNRNEQEQEQERPKADSPRNLVSTVELFTASVPRSSGGSSAIPEEKSKARSDQAPSHGGRSPSNAPVTVSCTTWAGCQSEFASCIASHVRFCGLSIAWIAEMALGRSIFVPDTSRFGERESDETVSPSSPCFAVHAKYGTVW